MEHHEGLEAGVEQKRHEQKEEEEEMQEQDVEEQKQEDEEQKPEREIVKFSSLLPQEDMTGDSLVV